MHIALINCTGEGADGWLGDTSLLDRLLSKLDAVRGLDEIVVLRRCHADMIKEGVEGMKRIGSPMLHELVINMAPFAVLRWAYKASLYPKRTSFIYCSPQFPFLDGGKIEAAICALSKTDIESAITTREGLALNGSASMGVLKPMSHFVPACIAIRDALLEDDDSDEGEFMGSCVKITINQLEAVDLSCEEGRRLAAGYENLI